MHLLCVCKPSGLEVRYNWVEGSLVSVSTGKMQHHSSGFGCFFFTAWQALLTRAALHVQLGEEPRAVGGEGGKRASSGFI